uniref:Uncharacterized protein n=1 Tax=Anguilla anguilla TaxID=7936 RepID=A0A0E9SLE8_ANGAN
MTSSELCRLSQENLAPRQLRTAV